MVRRVRLRVAAGQQLSRRERRRAGSDFDPDHYRGQLHARGLSPTEDLLGHYLSVGWSMGLDPHRDFSTVAYLEDHPDVRAAGVNPWVHYIRRGEVEKRGTRPSSVERAVAHAPSESTVVTPETSPSSPIASNLRDAQDRDRVRRESLVAYLATLGIVENPSTVGRVDADYYRSRYSGLVGAHQTPQAHYDTVGWSAGCSPTPWFDAAAYLRLYPDVAEHRIDPFGHFCSQGFREWRLPRSRHLERVEYVRTSVSLESVNARSAVLSSGPWDEPRVLADRVIARGADEHRTMILAVTHDDYLRNTGGVQRCVAIEQERFGTQNVGYLVVYPVRPMATLAEPGEEIVRLAVVLDGVPVPGALRSADLADFVNLLAAHGRSLRAVVVHSLFGHQPEVLAAQFELLDPERWVWWVHDYYTQCVNPTLTHDHVRPCGNPPLGSVQCTTCRFGSHRESHVRRLASVMESKPWTFVAPSEAAADQVTTGPFALASRPSVELHAEAIQQPAQRATGQLGRHLRIAYVGHPVPQKGWFTFRNLVQEHSGPEVEFLHLGRTEASLDGVAFVPLGLDPRSEQPAEQTIRECAVDAVLMWAEWPETFSLVTLEAIAASCVVICRSGSGNVSAMAHRYGVALEYATEDDLLDDRHLLEKVRSIRRQAPNPARVEFVGLTPGFLGKAVGNA